MNPRNNSQINKICKTLVPALLLWAVSFWTDTRIFSSDGLNMNCLPIDTGMILPMHILCKLLVLLFWIGFFHFLNRGLHEKRLLPVFGSLLLVYGIGLLVTYPGYYMSDDPIIFAYATRFLPVYWHNYLTSLFYMTGMSIFPASCGPVLLSDVIYAYVYTCIFEKGFRLLKKPSPLSVALLIAPGLLPFTLLGALMCFRPAIYASFFLYYFMYLYFERLSGARLTFGKLAGLTFLAAVLCLWRSESILLLPLSAILLPLVYLPSPAAAKSSPHTPLKVGISVFLMTLCFYALLSLPQKRGENAYYGSDYLIISTTRPLSVVVWRDQTYEGAEQDLSCINAVTDIGYLHNDSLSCSAYNRYNSDHNEGRYTQTGADRETQAAYLKSAFRLLYHNLDLYFAERLQLFCITNRIWNYPMSMVLDLKPVISTHFHLYEHDRDYGFEMLEAFKRIPLNKHEGYALFLFEHGGEAFLPLLLLTVAAAFVALFRKKWFYFFLFGGLVARELVIFLTAPASFIQYSYPTMFVVSAITLCSMALKLSSGRPAPSASQTEDSGTEVSGSVSE